MGKSNSEVGHVKNLANYNETIIILQGMGTLYNPAIPAIHLNKLLLVNQKAQVISEEFKTVTPLFKVSIAERAELYEPLNRLGTRVQNAFKAFRLGNDINDTMISLNKKLRGQRIVKIKKDKPEDEETATISTAQTSFDNKASTFDDMIKFAIANPAYKPNEVELQTATLKQYHTSIMKANNMASVNSVKLLNARKNRDELLYENSDNILELIRMIKDYLKSLKGAEQYYKKLVKLKFKSKAP